MRIYFATEKLQKIFNSEKKLIKKYGLKQTEKIKRRMKVLQSAANLAEVPAQKPDRRHQLKGNRKDQFAVDLYHPYRLIFKPEDSCPLLPDGGIDIKQVTGIIIIGAEDYHD
jgi:proteic killer suppression protein